MSQQGERVGLRTCVVRGEAIHVSYGQRHVLRGVDITLDRGDVVALMGRSGSGKTTLLRTLSGIVVPNSGRVWLRDIEVGTLGDRGRTELRRRHLGFVFQHSMLIPELTALENTALPLLLGGTKRMQADALAQEWLSRLGLSERGAAYPAQLSGGEAQRVAIARAVVNEPDVIFADEPTGSLDTENSEMVMDALIAVARGAGAAVLLVTHDPQIASYARRVHRIADGQIEST